jgi:ATP-dependent protease ClpP protease subunit
MSHSPWTKAEASKIQSVQDKTGKDLHAPEKQSAGDRNMTSAEEATAKGFATTSNYDEESKKPDPDYTKKIRGD